MQSSMSGYHSYLSYLSRCRLLFLLFMTAFLGLLSSVQAQSFQDWVGAFWPVAQREGIRPAVYKAAFKGMTPDPTVLEKIDHQPEFVKPFWSYLERATSEERMTRGQIQMRQWGGWLDQIARQYGVDPTILVAIWGMESFYGSALEDPKLIKNVLRSLASLAYDGGRYKKYARTQLIAALKIVQEEGSTPSALTGSWAGAMGHTQFIPTTYAQYAVDFDGDGRRDLWNSVPDALASAAHYLQKSGWRSGQSWGYEVILPRNFDYGLADHGQKMTLAEWQKRGVQRVRRQSFPRPTDQASLFLPAGAGGPAFLLLPNFRVLKRYNNADAYALAIGHLADRLRGGQAFVASWPLDNRPLSPSEAQLLQEYLAQKGYEIGHIDGKIGPRTRSAVRAYQQQRGLVPDGYPGIKLLEKVASQE